MLRVFGIPENDIRLTARELKEFEIEALFRAHEERKKTRVLRSRLGYLDLLMLIVTCMYVYLFQGSVYGATGDWPRGKGCF